MLLSDWSISGLVLVALSGCSTAHSNTVGSPLLVVPIEYDKSTQEYRLLTEGDTAHLVQPPQGGYVIFIGARVQNLEGTTMELTGRVRDASNKIVQIDTRTVTMEPVPNQFGWLQTDHESISQVSNIALCPDYDSVDIVGRSYLLEMEATAVNDPHTKGSTRLHVALACTQSDPAEQQSCTCECSANYTLGKCGNPVFGDASADAADGDAD